MRDMADAAFANQLRAAVERTLDSGYRFDREAALWAPGRRGERLQPRQAWSPLARVSHLFWFLPRRDRWSSGGAAEDLRANINFGEQGGANLSDRWSSSCQRGDLPRTVSLLD